MNTQSMGATPAAPGPNSPKARLNAYGLTGNIGCGKSTVATLLGEYPNVVIVDCDALSKEIIASGDHAEKINAVLGEQILPTLPNRAVTDPDEFRLIRKKIGAIIFNDESKRRALEDLLHPLVWAAAAEKIESAMRDAAEPSLAGYNLDSDEQMICIIESAIIFETGSHAWFKDLIVAKCSDKEQIRRLQANRHMTLEQIEAIRSKQLPSEQKEAQAKYIIDTNCSMEELRMRIDALYRMLNGTPFA